MGPVQGWDVLLLTLGGSGRVGSAVWALQTQAHTLTEPEAQSTGHKMECRELSSHGGPWEMGKQEQSSLLLKTAHFHFLCVGAVGLIHVTAFCVLVIC